MASNYLSGGGGGGNGDKSKWKLDKTSTGDMGKLKSGDGVNEENSSSKKSHLPVIADGDDCKGLEAQSTQQTRQEQGKGIDVESERETSSNSGTRGETNAEEVWDWNKISAELLFGTNATGPPHKGEKELPKGTDNALANLTFVISGVLDSLEFREVVRLIRSHGGLYASGLDEETDFIVADEDIREWDTEDIEYFGAKVLTEDELFAMINATGHTTSETDSERVNIVGDLVAAH